MGKKRGFLKRLFSALWKNKKVVTGPDKDFKENMKLGVKTGIKF